MYGRLPGMSKLRNKTLWRIICCACIALILFTFIAPLVIMIQLSANATDTDKLVIAMLPFAILIIWTVAFPAEAYLWYCFSCLFNPKKKSGGTFASVFMALALLLTVFFLWLIPQAFIISKQTFYVLFPAVLAAIIVCQISASIASAIHKAKLRKAEANTNT